MTENLEQRVYDWLNACGITYRDWVSDILKRSPQESRSFGYYTQSKLLLPEQIGFAKFLLPTTRNFEDITPDSVTFYVGRSSDWVENFNVAKFRLEALFGKGTLGEDTSEDKDLRVKWAIGNITISVWSTNPKNHFSHTGKAWAPICFVIVKTGAIRRQLSTVERQKIRSFRKINIPNLPIRYFGDEINHSQDDQTFLKSLNLWGRSVLGTSCNNNEIINISEYEIQFVLKQDIVSIKYRAYRNAEGRGTGDSITIPYTRVLQGVKQQTSVAVGIGALHTLKTPAKVLSDVLGIPLILIEDVYPHAAISCRYFKGRSTTIA